MKVYELKRAPNARRVRMFLAEKGVEMTYQQVDLGAGENLEPAFLAKNPAGRIPVLELDDGTCLSETVAICRYFEELNPEPNLFGNTALERATIEMWSRIVEFNLWLPTGMAFRHITGFYQDRETVFPSGGGVQAAGSGMVCQARCPSRQGALCGRRSLHHRRHPGPVHHRLWQGRRSTHRPAPASLAGLA